MEFTQGVGFGLAAAFRAGPLVLEERDCESVLQGREWSVAPRRRFSSDDFPVAQSSAELSLHFLFDEESLGKHLWSLPTADDEKFATLLHDESTPTESKLAKHAACDACPTEEREGGHQPGAIREKRAESHNASFFLNSSQGSVKLASRKNSLPDRLKAKIKKVRDFWGRDTLHIPNVFRWKRAPPNDSKCFLEQQDLSHKPLLVSSTHRSCGSAGPAQTCADAPSDFS